MARGSRDAPPDTGSRHAVVKVTSLRKEFGRVVALDDVDLEVRRGEFLTLLGPSGCGKTTLLRIIAGLERPTSGRVWIDGHDVTNTPPERRPLNMLFQGYALFPHLSVYENVAFGLRLERVPKRKIEQRVAEMLDLVRLGGYGDRRPEELSGGQQQRVALARALAPDPSVLLLDEPLSALDRRVRQSMQEELRAIQLAVQKTFIAVTHDQEEAMVMSGRIVLMDSGRVEQVAEPERLYREPSSTFAARFVGDANVLDGVIVAVRDGVAFEGEGLRIPLINKHEASSGARLMIRPEALMLWPDEHVEGSLIGSAQRRRSSFHGFYWLHHVRAGDRELIVRELRQRSTVADQDDVWVSVDPFQIVVLASEGS
jgi:ABC-type Fe3+/spermidine/putrescine transport system ATPase subunit